MVSRGEKPSVISAIMKYQTTERLRTLAQRCHGPARRPRASATVRPTICRPAYQAMPVAITVEGANILTRSLITFAQGALRSHPYLYQEIQACQDADEERGLAAVRDGVLQSRLVLAVERLRRLLPQHHVRRCSATCRRRPTARREWYRQLWRASRNFALRRRPDGRRARRRPQDQAEAHRPPRRRACPSSTCCAACSSATRTTASPPTTATSWRWRRRTVSSGSRRRCAAPSTTSPSRRCAG